MKIAKEGLLFIAPSLALAVLLLYAGWWPFGVVFLLLAAAFVFFFRDPVRKIPEDGRLILSPADGKVLTVEPLPSHPDLPGPVTRVCIFLSLFDVHLTRAPLTGTVRRVDYHPGKFFPAYRDEAGKLNESNTLLIQGEKLAVSLKQIVGVAARRIKCFVRADDRIVRGQKIGLMYFGSRVEVCLPPGTKIKTEVGQKVKAGESVIAEVEP
ncbi:phosphatidylserine decarboxylase [bacterium]|nr:MAG: phosphatidylserine decarboxylase [bacterium]